jgi:hypothetical protein
VTSQQNIFEGKIHSPFSLGFVVDAVTFGGVAITGQVTAALQDKGHVLTYTLLELTTEALLEACLVSKLVRVCVDDAESGLLLPLKEPAAASSNCCCVVLHDVGAAEEERQLSIAFINVDLACRASPV